MKDATKRSILRWIQIVFSIPILRLKNFQTTPPLFGLAPFLSLSLRGCGYGKTTSFDDLFRKDRPKEESERNEIPKIQVS